MKAYYINSDIQTVELVDLPETPLVLKQEVTRLLNADDYFIQRNIDKTMAIFIDADCLIKKGTKAFEFSLLPMPAFGNILIVGMNPNTDDFMNYPYSVKIEELNVKFYDHFESSGLKREALVYAASLHEE